MIFTTATTGAIKTVTITFPGRPPLQPGFDVANALLIERTGIGAGVLSVSPPTTCRCDALIYTVTSPVSIAKGTPIRFEIANINHPGTPGTGSISITTKNSLGNTIDGPTTGSSSVIQLGGFAIAPGAVGTGQLANGGVTKAKIAHSAVSISEKAVQGTSAEATITCPSGSIVRGGGFAPSGLGLQVITSVPGDLASVPKYLY